MSVVVEKRCKLCGKDVSLAKRTKDAAGNYYCEPCATAARGQQRAASVTTVAPRAAANATCANCGKAVGPLQQTWDWKGHQVCFACRDALLMEEDERVRQAAAKKAAEADAARQEATRRAQAAAVGQQRDRERHKLLLSGLVTSAVALLAFVTTALIGTWTSQGRDRTGLYIALGVAAFALLQLVAYSRSAGVPLGAALRRDLLPACNTSAVCNVRRLSAIARSVGVG